MLCICSSLWMSFFCQSLFIQNNFHMTLNNNITAGNFPDVCTHIISIRKSMYHCTHNLRQYMFLYNIYIFQVPSKFKQTQALPKSQMHCK